MDQVGHNVGPQMTGLSLRKQCWQAARKRLLPVLPIEVIRTRVRRAQVVGLDYKTYAGFRASTGHDLVPFLFSSNALRVSPAGWIPGLEAAKLASLQACGRIALSQGVGPDILLCQNGNLLTEAFVVPAPYAPFRDQVAALRKALGRISGDRVVLVADATWEGEWATAGRLPGVLAAARYFSNADFNK
jgi:hypothetical protein